MLKIPMLLTIWASLTLLDYDCNCNRYSQPTEPENQPPADSYAYYPFNGNAHDESGNGHHGVPVGSPALTIDRFGHQDAAYELNGIDQYLLLPAIAVSSNLSVSFWIRTTASDSNSFPAATFIIDRDAAGWARDWSICLAGGGRIEFNTGTTGGESILMSDSSVNRNIWTHVVAVRNATTSWKMIYVNGRVNGVGQFNSQPFSNNTLPICVGACGLSPASHRLYRGGIDDVRIFSRALTEAEIDVLYHDGGWANESNAANEALK